MILRIISNSCLILFFLILTYFKDLEGSVVIYNRRILSLFRSKPMASFAPVLLFHLAFVHFAIQILLLHFKGIRLFGSSGWQCMVEKGIDAAKKLSSMKNRVIIGNPTNGKITISPCPTNPLKTIIHRCNWSTIRLCHSVIQNQSANNYIWLFGKITQLET